MKQGYAFIEYKNYSEAKQAIEEMNGELLLETKISCSFAFSRVKLQ